MSNDLKLKEKYDRLENAARNLAEDCGCISPWRIDVLEITAPKEPKVKAQGLKELAHPCKGTCSGWQQGFEAGQKSKAATLKLPSEQEQRKFVDLHFCHSGLEYNSWGYVGEDALELLKKFCDAVKSMNEGSGE